MTHKIFIANATPNDIAQIGQRMELSGTVSAAIGFGLWGIEPTAVVEFGDSELTDTIIDFVSEVFAAYPDEEAVYLISGGVGYTWRRSGFNTPTIGV